MNQNQIGRTVFDIDEESDAFYFQKAIEYNEWLLQQEAQPRLTRTSIFRDHEDAERRLRADYFDDHSVIRQFVYGSTADAFDEYLQMSEHTARDVISVKVKESSRKGQNWIKTGQKRKAWRSREMPEAVTVDKRRKTEENKKRMNENAYTYQKLFKLKERRKEEGPKVQY
nr:hypothetical protein [Tanacetum cinerariifolium]